MRKELSYFKKKQDRLPAGIIPLVGAALACPPPEDTKKPVCPQYSCKVYKKKYYGVFDLH